MASFVGLLVVDGNLDRLSLGHTDAWNDGRRADRLVAAMVVRIDAGDHVSELFRAVGFLGAALTSRLVVKPGFDGQLASPSGVRLETGLVHLDLDGLVLFDADLVLLGADIAVLALHDASDRSCGPVGSAENSWGLLLEKLLLDGAGDLAHAFLAGLNFHDSICLALQ